MDEQDAPELAHNYIEKQKQIDGLDTECEELKDKLKQVLPHSVDGPKMWTFPDARVEWVKGRHSEKVDVSKLRLALVLLGVAEDVIKQAFEKATTTSDGEPSMRVTGLK